MMVEVRTTTAELETQAVEALADAFGALGLHAEPARESGTTDLVLDGPAGPIAIDVWAVNTLDPGRLHSLRAGAGTGGGHHVVVVADRFIGAVSDTLDELGWGYLDRRGHLRFQADGVFVDTDIAPSPRARAEASEPIAGRVAQGAALLMLMTPDHAYGIRELARALPASHSTVHDALTRLRAASLVERSGRPLVPDLFWALAGTWQVERTPVGRRPQNDPDQANSPPATAFAESGDRAAAHWGAPVAVRSESAPDLYVEATALARAVRVLGPADPDAAACTLAPAPVDALIREAGAPPADPGLLWVHPVVAALDLAQDRSRGQEILAEWTPPPEFTRVW
jgi:hypothetical protein